MSVSPFAEHTTRLTRALTTALVTERDDAALAARVAEIAAQMAAAAQDPEAVELADPHPVRAAFPHDITPVSSARNPIAPPLAIRREGEDSVATTVLPLQYQGPPTRVHGGIIALMLDQVLGDASSATGLPLSFTRELTITYDGATPIGEELRIAGRIRSVEGRKRFMEGEITVGGEVTVRAHGLWIAPREQSSAAASLQR